MFKNETEWSIILIKRAMVDEQENYYMSRAQIMNIYYSTFSCVYCSGKFI